MVNPISQKVKALEAEHAKAMKGLVAEHLQPLYEKEKQILADLDAVRSEIRSAEKSLGVVTSQKSTVKNAKPSPTPRMTDTQCQTMLVKMLQQKPDLTIDQVKELAKKYAKSKGFMVRGLSQRLGNLLDDDPRFQIKAGKVKLNKTS